MEYVEAGGARIPRVGLGTSRLTGHACVGTVETALDLGYRHIDTAQHYGNEAAIGEAMLNADVPREEIFITTKVKRSNLRADDVRQSVEGSLERLGVDAVDLLLIHWPHPRVPTAETLGAMEGLREEGKAIHLGVSNFTAAHLDDAIEGTAAPIVTDQVHCNVYAAQAALHEACVDHDVALTAYSPLAKGRVVDDDVLQEIGAAHEKTAAQVALRWLLQRENVVVIPRSADPEHLHANLEVFDFELTRTELDRITDLSGGWRATLRNSMPALVRSFPF